MDFLIFSGLACAGMPAFGLRLFRYPAILVRRFARSWAQN
jgi:hypothetical protein